MTGGSKGSIRRAFGARNRKRLLQHYFESAGAVTAENAWIHVYRLLLWIDRTTGLAHCYESDKSQPGRPWYERSLRFHDWVSRQLSCEPRHLAHQVDWLFRTAAEDLSRSAAEVSAKRIRTAERQRAGYEAFPEPGEDPELEEIIVEEMMPFLANKPPASALARLAERIHEHTRLENKRKNLVGEGFEDVLAAVIDRLPGSGTREVLTRPALHDVPGFFEPPRGEKTRKVDLAVLRSPEAPRILVTAKWSVRADREEQFLSDFEMYVRLEKAGKAFDYILVTNEFDPARLVAASRRHRHGHALFTHVVHVNPEGVMAAYGGNDLATSRETVARLIRDGKIISLADWLAQI